GLIAFVGVWGTGAESSAPFGDRRRTVWHRRRKAARMRSARTDGPAHRNGGSDPARHLKKRAEQAHPPTTEARSAALPACSDGFDNVDGGPERGVYIQMRRVEQVRIRRGFEGCRRAARVALVPPPDVGQHVSLTDAVPRALEL